MNLKAPVSINDAHHPEPAANVRFACLHFVIRQLQVLMGMLGIYHIALSLCAPNHVRRN